MESIEVSFELKASIGCKDTVSVSSELFLNAEIADKTPEQWTNNLSFKASFPNRYNSSSTKEMTESGTVTKMKSDFLTSSAIEFATFGMQAVA